MQRIFGVETEYGITCASTTGGKPPIDADQAARQLFQPVILHYRSSNVFTRNGGRLYLDVGSHPEYATAECNTLTDLLAQDQAGERLMSDLVTQANTQLAAKNVPGRIHLLKNNVDSAGNSCGCHENYLLHRDSNFRQVADALIAFFVTRQIAVGAGFVDRESGQYCFSQRADQMDDAISAATTRTRPIINTRDEPLADAREFRRMHVIVGDSNVCSTTTALKVGTTLALLAAVDQGMDITDLALADPMEAINRINHDLSATCPLKLKNGKEMSALQIQAELASRIYDALAGSADGKAVLAELDLGHFEVFELWNRTLEALRSGNLDLVATEIDWVIKWRLLERSAKRRNVPLTDPKIARLDFAYHDIGEKGLRPALLANGLLKEAADPQLVEQAMSTPPTTTRAHLRGKVIAAAQRHRRDVSVDWLHLRVDESKLPTITLCDPFGTSNTKVDELLAELES